ncbi:MAG: response regulator [Deltaproteobacteria bacterium]|nr:response regulator [Deltaproteobacteria bacterium]
MDKSTKIIDELVVDKQVLVVEDNEGLNKLIQKSLNRAGFDCFGVLSGADAIERVKKNPNQVLLIDQRLPDMDGTDLVRDLIDHTQDIIFVAMTGHGDEKIAVEMMKLGARDYLIKDSDLTEILPMVFKRVFSELETEQKLVRAEEELKKLGAAVQQSPVSIIITNLEGCIEYVNPKFCNLTGYSKQEVMGKNPNILQSGMAPTELYKNLWETILAGKEWRGEFQNKKKNGEYYWEDALISPIFNSDGAIAHFLAVKEDITNRKQFQKHLLQTQKMESIGNLAGGIAHDFNNILFPIVGMSEMLLEDLPTNSPEYQSAKEILKASIRGSELVKQILAFSRQSEHKMIPVRVPQILNEVLKLSRSTIPSNIGIKQDVQVGLGMVMANPTQIHQVAMNLITNAYHAVEPTGGNISVMLRETEFSRDDLSDGSLEPGRYAILSISDTGCGIDQSIMDKIFDPYFTTKAKGKGTGLGLAVVYGIVKEHLGDIKIYSEIEKSTTVEVFLPLIEDSTEDKSIKKVEGIQTGTEKILLVDDDESIAGLEKQMLERLGYEVTSKTSSLDVLETFRAHPDNFDLIVSDMTMPNLTGDQLSRELLSIRPGIPIIICTGFSEKINKENAQFLGIKGFLMKPVAKFDMAQMVRRVLDEAKGTTQT